MKNADLFEKLEEGRRREREQTLFYRSLTGLAEEAGNSVAVERLNALLADEQHHFSRLTARILELGGQPAAVEPGTVPQVDLDGWEDVARRREEEEVAWYQETVKVVADEETVVTLREILDSELHHREELGGKWMPAEPPHGGSGERR